MVSKNNSKSSKYGCKIIKENDIITGIAFEK